VIERGDILARLDRLEKQNEELLRLLRRLARGAGADEVPPEKRRKLIDGRWHNWQQGAGWLPEWSP